MSTAWTITFDCADPAVLAAFWCRALGYVEGAPPAGFATWDEWLASVGVPAGEWGDGAYIEDPDGLRPGISFLKVREPKTAKNRVHLDVQAGGGRGEPQGVRWSRVLEAVQRLTEACGLWVTGWCQCGGLACEVMRPPVCVSTTKKTCSYRRPRAYPTCGWAP